MTPPSGESVAPAGIWQVRDGGLARYGDWWSVEALQEALDGPEHPEGRIPRADVETLLRLIEVGIACLPGFIHGAAYRECVECGVEWFEGYESEPPHQWPCSAANGSRGAQ